VESRDLGIDCNISIRVAMLQAVLCKVCCSDSSEGSKSQLKLKYIRFQIILRISDLPVVVYSFHYP